jgi:site-specific DNA recombinase
MVESIDTASATGRMFLKIVGIFAEFERENLAERVRLGLERKAREGYSLASFKQSYGYNRESGNKIQEIVPEEAVIVKRIYSMYLYDDYTFNKIARTLNAEKIPTKHNKWWGDGTIKDILQNPNYIGKVRYCIDDTSRYFEAEGHHEPIIEVDVFNQVQEKIGKMKKITKTKRPTIGAYFCGVLYCPECGGKFSTKWDYNYHNRVKKLNGDGDFVSYAAYRCNKAIRGQCAMRNVINHAKLETAFEEYIATRYEDITETDVNHDEIADLSRNGADDHADEIAAITAELDILANKAEEIMRHYSTSTIDFASYRSMIAFNNERQSELQERLTTLQNTAETQRRRYTAADVVADLRTNWNALNNEQRLQFVQQFIKKLVIHSEPEGEGSRFRKVIIDEVQLNEH